MNRKQPLPVATQWLLSGLLLPVTLALPTVTACSEPTPASIVRVLNRPTNVAFACVGELRLTGGGPADSSQEIIRSPMPLVACQTWTKDKDSGEPPAGQEAIDGAMDNPIRPVLYAFIVQGAQGSIALAEYDPPRDATESEVIKLDRPVILDADRYTPGDNTIPIGSLPVGAVTDVSGCHTMTANAGTCDLSSVDVMSAIEADARAHVTRIPVANAAGEPIAAKPHSVVGDPRPGVVGVECTASPEGRLYIAYPDCHMVAVVEAATGDVVASVAFREDGTVEITDGDVGCGGTCGSVVPLGGAGRPVAIDLDAASQQLFIGLENRSELIIVDLDDEFMPMNVSGIPFEGDIGVSNLDVSEPQFENLGAPYRFVYAVATDGTVRVVEVEQLMTECETQADTRYLHDIRDTTFFPCMPVGDPRTPPRRLGAHSPGIHHPGDGIPLDVAFTRLDNINDDTSATPAPLRLDGYFAYITTSEGRVLLVNVNDERYPDFEPQAPDEPEPTYNPFEVDIALALPHRLRDFGSDRSMEVEIVDEETTVLRTCSSATLGTFTNTTLRPRLSSDVTRTILSDQISFEKGHLMPNTRRVLCQDLSPTEEYASVSELSLMADFDTLAFAYPDFGSVPLDEEWNMVWGGLVSLDGGNNAIDGPQVRFGALDVAAGTDTSMEILDAARPFCKMGLELYDVVSLIGCNPTRGDADCGTDEVCYVHPDAPSNVATGMCLPSQPERIAELSNTCRDILTSVREYSVEDVFSDYMTLVERRYALRTSPADGCVDAAECTTLYALEQSLLTAEHPIEAMPVDPETPRTFACEPDPSRAPGPSRCLMTCETASDCEDGYKCSDGYCVAGLVPPAVCVQSLQRYQASVGEAFAVIGSRSGFLHNRIVDANTGECIDDPEGNPLSVGRISLTAPPCTSDDIDDITPNPCSVQLTHTEEVPVYEVSDGTCFLQETTLQERTVDAIRFRNHVFTTHLVDPYPLLDESCNGDRLGVHAAFPIVFPGYRMGFQVTGGSVPAVFSMAIDTTRRLTYPASITRDPWGTLWIADQGDRSATIRGQVLWFSPTFLTDESATPTFYLR